MQHCRLTSRVAVPSPEGWQVQPQRPESPKLCRLYLLSSCLGGFIFMILFSPFVFFFFFFLAFFSSCVDVSVCFVFSAGLGVGGAFLLALTFHQKRGPGVGCAAPPRTKEQGVGRNPSYPRYQDWPGRQHGGEEKETERERSGSAAAHTQLSPPVTWGHCLPRPRPIVTQWVTLGKWLYP